MRHLLRILFVGITCCACLTCGKSFAQDSGGGGGLENNFDAAAIVGKQGYSFRARYYITPSIAARLGVTGNIEYNTTNFSSPLDITVEGGGGTVDPGSPLVLSRTQYFHSIRFTPGGEYHWRDGNFTTYAGGFFVLEFSYAYDDMKNYLINDTQVLEGDFQRGATSQRIGGWFPTIDERTGNISSIDKDSQNKRSGFGLGFGAVAGADYDFLPRFFVGLEAGFLFVNHFYGETRDTFVDPGNDGAADTRVNLQSLPNTNSLNFDIIANFKVGFRFF